MERIKVLLIEDNPGDARIIQEMLSEKKGVAFELEWKDELSKGMAYLDGDKVDLVLLDLNLPDSQGFDTFNSAKAQVLHIPIVVLTGYADETTAIKAVRNGAQDYIVKGQLTGEQLAQRIQYAIARRLGEERRFTGQELKGFDGKGARRAYIAHNGKVYDVSGSPMWSEGAHFGQHFSGNDLSGELTNAPHGEEVFSNFHIVGELTTEAHLGQGLLLKVEKLHPHPISVHFATAYPMAFALLAILGLFTGIESFDIASFYVLVLGFISAAFSTLSGISSWKITYLGKWDRTFIMKFIFTAALMVIITACLAWRILDPDILMGRAALSYVYISLAASLVPIVVILGHYGGKIVFG